MSLLHDDGRRAKCGGAPQHRTHIVRILNLIEHKHRPALACLAEHMLERHFRQWFAQKRETLMNGSRRKEPREFIGTNDLDIRAVQQSPPDFFCGSLSQKGASYAPLSVLKRGTCRMYAVDPEPTLFCSPQRVARRDLARLSSLPGHEQRSSTLGSVHFPISGVTSKFVRAGISMLAATSFTRTLASVGRSYAMRRSIAYVTLFAFLLQGFITQTHFHGIKAESGLAGALSALADATEFDKNASGHDLPPKDDGRHCPFCQAAQSAGSFVAPSPIAIAFPIQIFVSVVELTKLDAQLRLASHFWHGRAPPQI